MKKTLFLLIFLMISITLSAEVYLLVDEKTNEIISMSPEDDAVLDVGMKKVVLSGKLSDYELQNHPTFYKFKDGKFIRNIEKESNYILDLQTEQELIDEQKMINTKSRELAIKELKTEGKQIKYHNDDGTLKEE